MTTIAEWNASHPVGTPVAAYPGARPEDDPDCERLVTRTRSEAQVLEGHTDVVWVDGHPACIALAHIDVITESEYLASHPITDVPTAVRELGALPMPVGPEPQIPSEAPRLGPNPYSPYASASPDYRHILPVPVFFPRPEPGVLAATACDLMAVVPDDLIETRPGAPLPAGVCPDCAAVMQGGAPPERPSSLCGECGSATWHGDLCVLCRQENHERWWPIRNDQPTARGLTIKQPWAFAIAEGFKAVENRSRRTTYRGALLIHAGRAVDDAVSIVHYSRDAAIRLDELGGRSNYWDAREYLPSRIVPAPPTSLALSAVIATAELVGCHQAVDGCCVPWGFPDCWHWELANVQPLTRAVPKAGALGLWKPDAELLAAVAGATSVAEEV
jgi:hypothetical protein